MLENRAVVPTCLPLVFRVGVDRRVLDTWLLALCATCEGAMKPTVVQRLTARLHTTRGAGPAARLLRPDSRAARGSRRAMPPPYRLGAGGRLACRHRRTGPL